ncbi:phage holin family protein [Okibacterium endophyticum]
MKFLLRIVINAVAIWLTALIVGGINVTPFGSGDTLSWVLTYVVVGVIFAIVNGVVGTVVRIVAFPLYILSLGLISFIVNGLLLMLVGWIMSFFGWGLTVEGFWWGVLGALVLSIINWILTAILRPKNRR